MSRQFSFYLLPTDIQRLAAELRSRFDVKFISDVSQYPRPTELDSPIRAHERQSKSRSIWSVYCYLMAPHGAQVQWQYMAKRELWATDVTSEVIEFSGCDFDGTTLHIGRFYFQTDVLLGDTIWPKRKEFLEWGDKIFRSTKRLLLRSGALNAYVGADAAKWIAEGRKTSAV